MMKIPFISQIHYWLFSTLVNWEIYNRIFPQLNGHSDHGYPFTSKSELTRLFEADAATIDPFFRKMKVDMLLMPDALGIAFRYILWRDLKRNKTLSTNRMRMYKLFASSNAYPEYVRLLDTSLPDWKGLKLSKLMLN